MKKVFSLLLIFIFIFAGCKSTTSPAPSASQPEAVPSFSPATVPSQTHVPTLTSVPNPRPRSSAQDVFSDNNISKQPNVLRIYFINVGKGDAVLIGTSTGKWIMVDVGPKKMNKEVLKLLRQNNVQQLDTIFISHPHKDHAGALANILKNISCKQICIPYMEDTKDSKKLRKTISKERITIQTLYSGNKLQIDDIMITAIGPNGNFINENDNSLALLLEWKGLKVFFAGDQLFDSENELLKSKKSIQANVLKVGHHGQEDATSQQFLEAINPQYCIITNNKPVQTSRFTAGGAKAYVLSETGTILLLLENGNIEVSTTIES